MQSCIGVNWQITKILYNIIMSDHNDFQNKYVGYMVLALILGVLGIGVIGLLFMIDASICFG